MSMTVFKSETLKMIERVLRRFKLHELEKCLHHYFTEKSWDKILEKFSESELPVNVANIARFYCKAIKKKTATEVFEIGETCLVFDVHLHMLRKMWRLVEMSGGESIGMVTSTGIKEKIIEECEKRKIPVHVTSLRNQSNYWVAVRIKKQKKRGAKVNDKFYAPIFFAIPINDTIMGTSAAKTNATKDLIRAVANAIGYNRAAYVPESGRDMVAAKKRLAWTRERKNISVPTLPKPKVKFARMSNGNGIDFSNRASQVRHMDALFGPDVPAISRMQFCTKTVSFNSSSKKDEWSEVRMTATLVLKSNDVVKFVNRLTLDHEMFEFPPPPRVTNYFKDQKNPTDEDSDA